MYAENAYVAKQLGKAQYGVGHELCYTEVWVWTRIGYALKYYAPACEYIMRTHEVITTKLLSPEQARILSM